MSKYTISYFGEPSFDSPEAGSKYQEKWRAWMGTLGDALVNNGIFLGVSKVINSDGVTDADTKGRLTGYSIIEADSMEASVEMAKGCPHVEHSTIEVAKIEMEM